MDVKPKKRHRKYIEGSNRQAAKREIEGQIKDSDEYLPTPTGFYYGDPMTHNEDEFIREQKHLDVLDYIGRMKE